MSGNERADDFICSIKNVAPNAKFLKVRPQSVVWDVRTPASGASLLDSVNGTDPVEEPGCCIVAVGKPVNKLECRKEFKNDVIQLQEAQSTSALLQPVASNNSGR